MLWTILERVQAWKIRRALPAALRDRRDALHAGIAREADERALQMKLPLPLARCVVLDLETTGPDMFRDRIISIGAVAVNQRSVRHDDAFEEIVRQDRSSEVENILIHQIGGQQQLGGADPAVALMDLLAFLGTSVAFAFRAEFDSTVLHRELQQRLGMPLRHQFIDLAIVLPALFPDLQNDSLDDWIVHFGLPPIGRHHAIADAYASAQLMLIAFEQAQTLGIETPGDLAAMETAQRWLGKRR
jgi:DNA polymerase-3 subunit epsilon